MPRPKKIKLTFSEKLLRIKHAGLKNLRPPDVDDPHVDKLETVEERIERIFRILNKYQNNPGKMVFFIMYDIENNKVRNQIAKYLLKKGCIRIQKSIFLAETERKLYQELHKTLKEVQDVYENNDSILFVPLSVDELKAMKMIGQQVDIDFIMNNRSTMFF